MRLGKVKFFNSAKAFGFIQGDDGVEYFVGAHDIVGGQVLRELQVVEFDVAKSPRGPRAKNVRSHVKAGPRVFKSQPGPSRPLTFKPLASLVAPPLAAVHVPSLGEKLATFMGLGPSTPTFQLGNSLVREPAFKIAAHEMFAIVEGRLPKTESAVLVTEVVRVLRDRGIDSRDAADARVSALVAVLEPFFRLIEPNAGGATLKAVLAAIRRQVTAHFEEQKPVLTPQLTAAAPTERIVAESKPLSPPSGPDSVIPPVVPKSVETEPHSLLLEQVAEVRRANVQREVAPLLTLGKQVLTDLERFAERPFEFSASASLARTLSGLAGIDAVVAKTRRYLAESEERVAEHRQAIDIADAALDGTNGDLPLQFLEELALPESAVNAARRAAAASSTTENLPSWLVSRWFGQKTTTVERLVSTWQTDAGVETVEFMKWFEQLSPESRRLLPKCPEPAPGPLLEEMKKSLDGLLQREREEGSRRGRIEALRPHLGAALLARLSNPDVASDAVLSRAEGLVRRVHALRQVVHAEVYASILGSLAKWTEHSEEFPQHLQAVEDAAIEVGAEITRDTPSVDLLMKLGSRLKNSASVGEKSAAPPRPSADTSVARVSVAHAVSIRTGGSTTINAASAHWSLPAGKDFGIVRLPARIKFEPPPENDTEWKIEITSDLLSSVPASWKSEVLTSLVMQVPARSSYRDFMVELPMSRNTADLIASENRAFSVNVDAARGTARTTTTLTWQGLQRGAPEFRSPFPQTVSLREMTEQPLGIEREFQRLVGLARQGRKSFRVHGPRRMGKTTLVKALAEELKAHREIVLLPLVVATEFQTTTALWNQVGALLGNRFERLVPQCSGLVPAPDAFDKVRESAAGEGIKAIYVLIDEAQALFAMSGEPHLLGESLKSRLESSWGVRDDGRASILFGLVGQAHLQDLMGANLIGAIGDAFTTDSLHADDLVPLLRATSSLGLQSTAEARTALARQSGNLWILDRLLSRVMGTCQEQGRAWFVEEDVENAVKKLVASDRNGTDTSLWTYVRDVLNDSDNKNDWKPSETFGVALAWALARSIESQAAAPRARRIENILTILKPWCSEFQVRESRVEEAFRLLRNQRVLRADDSFELPVLERLLAARALESDPFADEAERASLTRLGFNRISMPVGESPESSGGQADIFKAELDGKKVAVRRVRLAESKAEERFLREVALLEKLRDAPGEVAMSAARHVPRLINTGIDPAAPNFGLVIYEWIEGTPLTGAELKPDGALLVLAGLLRALHLLDVLHVVHRDIRPANIIMRKGRFEPVLIDFGLSVAVDEISQTTSLGGVLEFIPPEVKTRGASAWTSKGDAYSVAKSIELCLAPSAKSDTELTKLLHELGADDPALRAAPEELLKRLLALHERRKLGERTDEIAREFRQAVDGLSTQLRAASAGSEGDFLAARTGISSRSVRLVQAAEFLENLVSALVAVEFPEVHRALRDAKRSTVLSSLSMAAPLPARLRPLVSPEGQAIGLMRNGSAHPREMSRKIEEALRELRVGPATDEAKHKRLEGAVQNVAAALAGILSAPGVSTLVGRWFAKE